MRAQVVETDREHDRTHLLPQDDLEALEQRRGSEEPEMISRLERGSEERQSLDVIPMGMTEEHVARDRSPVGAVHQRAPEFPDARAGVEDDEVSVIAADLHTCGVSTVRDGRRSR
jgi:hypothetical protein